MDFINLIDAGFALVPIPKGTKKPMGNQWNQIENVISKPEQISKLINLNIGIAHAYCRPTPTCAIDIDNYPEALVWLEGKGVKMSDILEDPETVAIYSGKKFSMKFLYRLPQNTSPLITKQIHSPDGKMMLEFRCATKNGKTVQDLLPPSIHPETKKAYIWCGNGHFSRLSVIPKPLLDIWLSLISSKNIKTTEIKYDPNCLNSILTGQPETPRSIANTKEMLRFIDANCSYNQYRDVIWAIADTGWSCALELAKEWSLTAPHRFEESTLLTIFHSFNITRGIHYGTLVHHARKGGYDG